MHTYFVTRQLRIKRRSILEPYRRAAALFLAGEILIKCKDALRLRKHAAFRRSNRAHRASTDARAPLNGIPRVFLFISLSLLRALPILTAYDYVTIRNLAVNFVS